MSLTTSYEALLISALLQTGDVEQASRYGITERHFKGYGEEYAWCLRYLAEYRTQPSIDAFCDQFPDFPFRTHEDVRYAADMVMETFLAEQLQSSALEAMEALRRGNIPEAYQIVQRNKYTKSSALPANLATDMSFLDDFEEERRGIEVPYPTLQSLTGGIRPGNLWYLAARLGQGKSAYLCDIATHALLGGSRILYYSLEMTEHELRARIHTNLAARLGYAGFTAKEIISRTVDRMSYKAFLTDLDSRLEGVLHVHTPMHGSVTPGVLASRAEEYDLIVVDYATLMYTDTGQPAISDWRYASEISNRLKQIALASNTPILAAAQINRDGETAGDAPPRVKNLAQADALGQDGDVVVTLRTKLNTVSHFSLEKNRHGPSEFRWWTSFDVNNGCFTEITEDKALDRVLEAEDQRTA